MIVTTATASAAVLLGPDGEHTRIRTLAQRSMLHSETDTFEHLRLSSGARLGRTGRTGSESVWYVLRGPVLAEQLPVGNHYLGDAGDLLLVPRGGSLQLQAGPLGAELIGLTLQTPTKRPRSRRTSRP